MAKEKKELIVGVNGDLSDNFTTGQKAVLGLQNTLAMCGVIRHPVLRRHRHHHLSVHR